MFKELSISFLEDESIPCEVWILADNISVFEINLVHITRTTYKDLYIKYEFILEMEDESKLFAGDVNVFEVITELICKNEIQDVRNNPETEEERMKTCVHIPIGEETYHLVLDKNMSIMF